MTALNDMPNPSAVLRCPQSGAPRVGRYKWVMLDRLDAVGWAELRELIRQSYEMVAAKASKKKRKAKKKNLSKRRPNR